MVSKFNSIHYEGGNEEVQYKFGQEHQRHIRKHRWEHWRETERRNMLHLTDERRMKIGKAINDYFILRT